MRLEGPKTLLNTAKDYFVPMAIGGSIGWLVGRHAERKVEKIGQAKANVYETLSALEANPSVELLDETMLAVGDFTRVAGKLKQKKLPSRKKANASKNKTNF